MQYLGKAYFNILQADLCVSAHRRLLMAAVHLIIMDIGNLRNCGYVSLGRVSDVISPVSVKGTKAPCYFQTGETKYGKQIIDRVITASTTLKEAAKCVLLFLDSTMCSNFFVGRLIDLLCYETDNITVQMGRRFEPKLDWSVP